MVLFNISEDCFLSGKRDSDPRPLVWETNALPTELFPLFWLKIIYEMIVKLNIRFYRI